MGFTCILIKLNSLAGHLQVAICILLGSPKWLKGNVPHSWDTMAAHLGDTGQEVVGRLCPSSLKARSFLFSRRRRYPAFPVADSQWGWFLWKHMEAEGWAHHPFHAWGDLSIPTGLDQQMELTAKDTVVQMSHRAKELDGGFTTHPLKS